ncbi:cell surface protein [bacterium]|nr:MAG: cell surface protein [bacterium]
MNRKNTIALLSLGLTLCSLSISALADGLAKSSYPKFRGDLQNTGRSEGKGAKGELAWSVEAGLNVVFSATTAPDGTIYFASNTHKLFGLDKTGKGWTVETETLNGSSSGPGQAVAVGADGTIYVPDAGGYDDNNRGRLVAYDGKTGTQKWAYKAKAAVYSSPAIGDNGLIYFGSQDGFLYAVTQAGQGKWKFDTGGQVRSSPAVGKDGTVYIGSHNPNIYALDGTTGKQKWVFTTSGPYVQSSPAIGEDGTVYVACTGSMTVGPPYLYALDGKTGKMKWKVESCTQSSSVAIGKDGTIFTQGESGNFYALDPATGKQKWKVELAIPQASSPAIDGDGTVYVAAGRTLHALDPETGNEKWSFDTKSSIYSSPAIADDGTIYIGDGNGFFYAIK